MNDAGDIIGRILANQEEANQSLSHEGGSTPKLYMPSESITVSDSTKLYKRSPKNTFVLSHPTLNRLKTTANGSIYNFEADCSDNGNNGTWYGSGINGSQFAPSNEIGDSTDSSGNGYDGVDTDITYTSGKVGNAADFNGTSSYIKVAANTDIADLFSGGGSIAFWVKTTASNVVGYLFYKMDTSRQDGWRIYIADETGGKYKIHLGVYFDSASGNWYSVSTV